MKRTRYKSTEINRKRYVSVYRCIYRYVRQIEIKRDIEKIEIE